MRRIGKKKIKSNKHIVDNIEFKSGLEVYMFRLFKENGVKVGYETMTFELISPFKFNKSSFERKGKGDLIEQGFKNVRGISYTPDFVGEGFIVETKGRANESFPLRWKLFKKLIIDKDMQVDLYKPQSQKDCDDVINAILKKIKK